MQQGSQSTRLPERIVLLIIDGLGDVTIPDLGDRTPLEVAHTPCLDAIAGQAMCVVIYDFCLQNFL